MLPSSLDRFLSMALICDSREASGGAAGSKLIRAVSPWPPGSWCTSRKETAFRNRLGEASITKHNINNNANLNRSCETSKRAASQRHASDPPRVQQQ